MRVKRAHISFDPHQGASLCEEASWKLRQYLSTLFKATRCTPVCPTTCGEGVADRRLELDRARAETRMKSFYIEALRRATEEEQKELFQLERKCKALVDETNSIISRKRSRITLPVEIVLQILSYLWPPSTQDCSRIIGVRPTEVAIAPCPSLDWKAAIEHVNSWSRTRYYTTRSVQPAHLREALLRSAPARLDVHLGDMYPGTDAFLAVAAEFRDRWDTLSINAAYWNRQGASFDQLKRLGILLSTIRNLIIYPHDYCQVGSEWVSTWCGTPSILGSEETPRLRTADIPASCLSSFTSLFNRLHSLTLHISQSVNGCSREAFSGLKALARLSLKDCSHAREFFSDVRNSKPIVLPYLQELAIDAIDSNAIPVVASSLSCRRLRKLTIGSVRFPNFNSKERTIEVYQALSRGLCASYPTVETLDLRSWPNTVLYELLKGPAVQEGYWLFPRLVHLMWDMSENEGIGILGEIKKLYFLAELRRTSQNCVDLRVIEIDLLSETQKAENAIHFQASQFYGLDVIIHTDRNI